MDHILLRLARLSLENFYKNSREWKIITKNRTRKLAFGFVVGWRKRVRRCWIKIVWHFLVGDGLRLARELIQFGTARRRFFCCFYQFRFTGCDFTVRAQKFVFKCAPRERAAKKSRWKWENRVGLARFFELYEPFDDNYWNICSSHLSSCRYQSWQRFFFFGFFFCIFRSQPSTKFGRQTLKLTHIRWLSAWASFTSTRQCSRKITQSFLSVKFLSISPPPRSEVRDLHTKKKSCNHWITSEIFLENFISPNALLVSRKSICLPH